MAVNITASGSQSIGLARAIRVQINNALAGTIVISTAGSTQYGTVATTQATITNPAAGQSYLYGGLQSQGNVLINPSGAVDISVTKLLRNT